MKLRTTLFSVATLLSFGSFLAYSGALAQTGANAKTESYKVDGVHSTIIFRIQHLGVSYFYGRINNPSGRFSFNSDDPSACSFEVQALTKNVDTNSAQRDRHLKSADFFNAKQFPDIKFTSSKVRKRGTNTYQVAGELSLHGVTRPITLDLQYVGSGGDPWGGYRCGFDTTFAIKRSDFGMEFMQGPLGDEVTLMIGLEGVRE